MPTGSPFLMQSRAHAALVHEYEAGYRRMDAREALAILKFLPQRAARSVAATVRSAVANAENNFNMDPDELIITRCAADEGRTLKRWRPRARGRVNQILKRSSHITVVVAEKEA